MKRLEEVAFTFYSDTVWLAYRYSGGNDIEKAFTTGVEVSESLNGDDFATIRDWLEDYFCPRGPILFPPFIGCQKGYLDQKLPEGIKAVIGGFLAEVKIPYTEVKVIMKSLEEVNTRWAEPMGEPLTENDMDLLALLTMEAGIAS